MVSIKEILQKADVWGIRAYRLEDQPLLKCGFEDYETYIEKTETPVFNLLSETFHNQKELDLATDFIVQALSAREDVYFEMGLRAGVKLLYELLYRNETL